MCKTKYTVTLADWFLAGVWWHRSISSLYSFAFSFCFHPSSPPSTPFSVLNPLSHYPSAAALLPSPIHAHMSSHILQPPAVPVNTQQLAMACPPKRRGNNSDIPSRTSLRCCHQETRCWHRHCAGPRNQTPARRMGALPVGQTQLTVIPCCLLCLYCTDLLGLQDTLKISPSPITCLLHKMSTDVSLLVSRKAVVNNF